MSNSNVEITKVQVIKKGRKVFGSNEKFNRWLNTMHFGIDCKPISLWDNSEGLNIIYEQLIKIEQK